MPLVLHGYANRQPLFVILPVIQRHDQLTSFQALPLLLRRDKRDPLVSEIS